MRIIKNVNNIFCLAALFSAFAAGTVSAQSEIEKINLDPNKQITKGDHQIPSPKTQRTILNSQVLVVDEAKSNQEPLAINRAEKTFNDQSSNQIASNKLTGESAANNLAAVARRESLKAKLAAKPLTDLYRVGVGDILDVRLRNVNDSTSTLFTILDGGLLDYPLAGEAFQVAGLTTEEIAEMLSEKVKLYDSPEIIVGVRDYASHKIVVTGAVEKPGIKLIRREAVPLFTIMAEAVQLPHAASVTITRGNKEMLDVSLKNLSADVLVYDGDLIKVSAENPSESVAQQFYFIAGFVQSPGQKEFHQGLTVTQVILAAGGSLKANKAVIFRQNAEGFLAATEVDLKMVKSGKMQDIAIQSGDRIEIK